MNQDVVSFMLRFVREESSGQPARWRGVIKHVQSDHSVDFARFHDALSFMQTHVDEAILQAFGGTTTADDLLAETARLWGEVAPRYTEIMLQSMEMMLAQGRRVSESLADSVASWASPAPPLPLEQQEQMLNIIERLTAQMDVLTSKVDRLESQLRDDE